jgi:para-nitrobenzyl esterase
MMRMLAGVSLAAGLAACAAGPETATTASAPKAKVEGGVIVGAMEGDIAEFKGVPYAAAPVGSLRWKPPQKVVAWTGERQAASFGASCTQSSRLGAEMRVSEDCLFLNVWSPKAAKNAPVMVWIHGGSNLNGSGAIYNGAAFAKDGIVFVTVNYRMGGLGFFAHPEITKAAAKDEPLANYGLMDQTAALQWVQRNIGAFGGDPKRVTVFGESAGAIDIYALLGLKTSKGLFSQAIIESNITWGESASLAVAEADGKKLAGKAGASDTATLADLRAIPAEKFVTARGGDAEFPMVDGRFMTETSLSAMANKHTVDVPLIVGSNSHEATLVASVMPQSGWTGWTNAQAGAPARFIAAKSADGAPSWLYFFSYVATAQRETAFGAGHAAEIAYVYDGAARPPGGAGPAPPGAPRTEPTAEDKAMAALMHSCWVAFAKTGEPKCASGPAWPNYTPASDKLMEFGLSSGVRTNFRKAELDTATAAQAGAK